MTDGASGKVKIRFSLEQDEEGYPPAADEFMWADVVGDGSYRIDNIPFFVQGVSLRDDVVVDVVGGELVFSRLHRNNGHRTLRLVVRDPSNVPAVRDRLRSIGCTSELSHIPILVAVDVPPEVPAAVIQAFLVQGEAAGEFGFEEACIDW